MVSEYGLKTVQEYMYHIRANAELSVRNLLRDVAKHAGSNVLSAIDYLDDGSPVRSLPVHNLYPISNVKPRYNFVSKSTRKRVPLFWTSKGQVRKSATTSTLLLLLFTLQ